jgi:restriction endonuclease Mrr
MKDNPGNPYEELSQIVFQSILSQGDLPNVAVQHNVTLRGKHTNHQIDVYWKFEVGGIQYETIVQAKDWKNPVNQGELLKFKGVLDDLPGQPKGIFVTRTGYQSGAKEWAFAHGILLYELKEF